MAFSWYSACFSPRLFASPRETASSSESWMTSSVAGCTVMLPKYGFCADDGLDACDCAPSAQKTAATASIPARRTAGCSFPLTDIILSDERGAGWDSESAPYQSGTHAG